MPDQPYTSKAVYEALTAFLGGVNSGLNPILLDKSQLAFAVNATVRGGFISPRPPFRKMTLDFGEDGNLQAAFELGFYQGGTPYRPDFGNHSLLAAISGRLFQATISGQTATIRDVSVPNDPNPPQTTQSWLWQGEKWVIWNNGLNLPIIFDGTKSVRTLGPSTLLASPISLSPGVPPAIGGTVVATLPSSYTGQLNTGVLMNGAYYQTLETFTVAPVVTPATYKVTLTSTIHEVANIPSGSDIVVDPSRITKTAIPGPGKTYSGSALFPGSGYVVTTCDGTMWEGFVFVRAAGALITEVVCAGEQTNAQIVIAGQTFQVVEIGPVPGGYPGGSSTARLIRLDAVPYGSIPVLDWTQPQYVRKTTSDPAYVVGKTTTAFVNPAEGSSIVVELTAPYTGINGQVVWIGDDQYTISSPQNTPTSTTPPGNFLILINVTDAAGAYSDIRIFSIPGFPIGRMGAYGMGRNWVSGIDGVSFFAGNIVGGEGGTPGEAYRDSILHVTENDILNGGGSFRLPSAGDVITAMAFTTKLDASLGQGPLQVFTTRSAFSVDAPTDRLTWQDVTFPILTQSLIGLGALAQQSTFTVNSDTFFRSNVGWYSLIQARRDISDLWGNSPMTREMERVLAQEEKTLIPYVSGTQFDNRALFSAVPQSTASGIASSTIVALNLDPISSIAAKSPPLYDGAWVNLNTLQIMRAVINSVDRAFAFVHNTETLKIELWELLATNDVGTEATPASQRVLYDNDGTQDIPITWSFETAAMFTAIEGRPLLRLLDGEIRIEDAVGTVDFQVFYKPDGYPCWTPWHRWSICVPPAATDEPNLKPGYRPRMGLGEPLVKQTIDGVEVTHCDTSQDPPRPLREGYTFQFKIAIRGHCRFIGATFAAVRLPEKAFASPVCDFSGDPS